MKLLISKLQIFFSIKNKDIYKIQISQKNVLINKGTFHRIVMLLATILFNLIIIKALYSITIYSFEKWLSLFVVMVVICFIYQCFQLIIIKCKLFSVPFLFLIFTYVFHLSFAILIYFKVEMGNIMTWFTLSEFKSASTLSLFFILFLTLGYIFSDLLHLPLRMKWKMPILDKDIVFFGYLLLIISLSASLYITVTKIYTLINSDYLEAATMNINIIVTFTSYLLLPAIFILSLYYKEDKKKASSFIFIYIAYLLLSMITGQRAYALIQIVLILLLYNIYISSFTFKKIVILFASGIFILIWIAVIKQFRSTGNFSLFQFDELRNILIDTLKEFGSTIHVITRTVAYDSNGLGIGGKQLLCTILTPIPYVSQLFPNIFSNNIYTTLDLFRLGGSFIADFYYDFGYLGCIGISFFGILIAKIDGFIRMANKKNYYFIIAAILPFVIELMFSVRSGLYTKTRTLVYCFVLYLCFYFVSKMILKLIKFFVRR